MTTNTSPREREYDRLQPAAGRRTAMVRAKRALPGRPAKRKANPRTQLLRDVEEMWCALSAAVALFQARSAAQRGLTMTDLQAIDILARQGGVCASDLASECGLTPGAITGMLNRLERAGVARRSRDEADARRLVIRAVEDQPGRECRIPPTFRKVAASFSDADLKSVRRFLRESALALRREAGDLP